MACPYTSRAKNISNNNSSSKTESNLESEENNYCEDSTNNLDRLTYAKYLKLHKVLDAQTLLSAQDGKLTPVHDEHLFIITHQTFELWFKQILEDLNSIRDMFFDGYIEERNHLIVISRLNRISAVIEHISHQFALLETMTPQAFYDMRKYLETASGFESLQFRLIEIKMGVNEKLRILRNNADYANVFHGQDRESLEKAKSEKSLFFLVNDWLERTPGLEENEFNFFNKFKLNIKEMLKELKAKAEADVDSENGETLSSDFEQQTATFESLFNKQIHNDLLKKGARRFSHMAMQGALMISLYRDEPRFHLPFQILQCLVDIDNNFTKFRYNHACMVQRMIGSKIGTGGSSGYLYLRSTCSDRYKVFIDLMNLSNYLVDRDRIPPLTCKMKKCLSIG